MSIVKLNRVDLDRPVMAGMSGITSSLNDKDADMTFDSEAEVVLVEPKRGNASTFMVPMHNILAMWPAKVQAPAPAPAKK